MNLVISSAVRTPMGAFQGAFATVPAARLGAAAVAEAVRRAGVAPDGVDAVLLGNVLQAGQGQAPARQAAIHAGLSQATPAVTLNKMCGSGLESVIQAGRAVLTGDAEVVVAGGMESMTNAPYLTLGARAGLRLGDAKLVDSLIHDGLWDAYGDKHMGSCAELCAAKYSFSRAAQDEYAERSYRRAQAAVEGGTFAAEIVPVEVAGRRGTVRVEHDEGPSQVDFEKMLKLRPAFEPTGTITAANASTLNDGAAALVVTSEGVATSRGMPVLARIHGWAGAAVAPEWFTVAPVEATRKLFAKLGWTPESVDLFEVNEAFSVVPMAVMAEFGLSAARVNVLGGAVALGHPIGASGARILVTLMNALRLSGKRRGVASICIGGGEGLALGLELA
ncbi:MAG: thiolase family protein [Trueperaceae bacterium]|nr:thiolase family protein [Trueperaceae bacterium]MCC6311020.1 thiolase family protein [Trueperaceae bacterium]MCO5175025.1 thiolase family protein [Trueperaceae bacterium]MCW5819561.1 thiolase family protein [Trueperaceae bacterium]